MSFPSLSEVQCTALQGLRKSDITKPNLDLLPIQTIFIFSNVKVEQLGKSYPTVTLTN